MQRGAEGIADVQRLLRPAYGERQGPALHQRAAGRGLPEFPPHPPGGFGIGHQRL